MSPERKRRQRLIAGLNESYVAAMCCSGIPKALIAKIHALRADTIAADNAMSAKERKKEERT